MSKPRLLDLFCGAGGAAMGYASAGFQVIGVDIEPQPHYPFEFIRADAMAVLDRLLTDAPWWYNLRPGSRSSVAAIHASPPCQAYSAMTRCRPGLAESYPDLIGPLRGRLRATGVSYVIENVEGAPLVNPTLLCGEMFGLRLHRHRLFESNVPMPLAFHPPHSAPGSRAGRWKPGTFISVAGHCAPIAEARAAMGIGWMTRDELAESIPPAYCEWVGAHLLAAMAAEVAS